MHELAPLHEQKVVIVHADTTRFSLTKLLTSGKVQNMENPVEMHKEWQPDINESIESFNIFEIQYSHRVSLFYLMKYATHTDYGMPK